MTTERRDLLRDRFYDEETVARIAADPDQAGLDEVDTARTS